MADEFAELRERVERALADPETRARLMRDEAERSPFLRALRRDPANRTRHVSDPVTFAQRVMGDWDAGVRDDARVLVVAGSHHEFREYLHTFDREDWRRIVYVGRPDALRGLSASNVSRVVYVGTYTRSPVFRSPELAHLVRDIRRREGVQTCDVCGAAMTERAPVPVTTDFVSADAYPPPHGPEFDTRPRCPVCARAPWLPHVSTIEVRREQPEYMTMGTMDGRRNRFLTHSARPHRPLVTQIELDAQMPVRFRDDFGARNVRATANCGNRTELWEFRDTPGAAWMLSREAGYAEPFANVGDVMVRVAIELGAAVERLRDALAQNVETFAAQMDSSFREIRRALDERLRDGPASDVIATRPHALTTLRDSLRELPRVSFDDATLNTPAQYAAFVEFGRSGELPARPFMAGADVAARGRDATVVARVQGAGRLVDAYRAGVERVRERRRESLFYYLDEVAEMPADIFEDAARYSADWSRTHATEAHARAEQTLLRYLDERQREMYAKSRSFLVRSQHGRIYRVTYGKQFNVVEMREKKRSGGARVSLAPLASFCAAPADCHALPVPDVMLAQTLMLQTDESAFRKIANRSPFGHFYSPAGLDYESDVPLDEWPPRRS